LSLALWTSGLHGFTSMTNVLAAVEPTANDWKKVGADPIPN